jgi:hypothetical protein
MRLHSNNLKAQAGKRNRDRTVRANKQAIIISIIFHRLSIGIL